MKSGEDWAGQRHERTHLTEHPLPIFLLSADTLLSPSAPASPHSCLCACRALRQNREEGAALNLQHGAASALPQRSPQGAEKQDYRVLTVVTRTSLQSSQLRDQPGRDMLLYVHKMSSPSTLLPHTAGGDVQDMQGDSGERGIVLLSCVLNPFLAPHILCSAPLLLHPMSFILHPMSCERHPSPVPHVLQ